MHSGHASRPCAASVIDSRQSRVTQEVSQVSQVRFRSPVITVLTAAAGEVGVSGRITSRSQRRYRFLAFLLHPAELWHFSYRFVS